MSARGGGDALGADERAAAGSEPIGGGGDDARVFADEEGLVSQRQERSVRELAQGEALGLAVAQLAVELLQRDRDPSLGDHAPAEEIGDRLPLLVARVPQRGGPGQLAVLLQPLAHLGEERRVRRSAEEGSDPLKAHSRSRLASFLSQMNRPEYTPGMPFSRARW